MNEITITPCLGNDTCCNRPEFDRAMFPCKPERMMADLYKRVKALEADNTKLKSWVGVLQNKAMGETK